MSEQVMFTTGAVALSHQSNAASGGGEAPSRSPLLPGHDENVVEEEEVDVLPGRPLQEDAAVFHVGGQLPPLDHPPGGRHQREGLGEGNRKEGKFKHVHVRARMETMRILYGPIAVSHTIVTRARLSRLVHRLHRYWPSRLPWRCCVCMFVHVCQRASAKPRFLPSQNPIFRTCTF